MVHTHTTSATPIAASEAPLDVPHTRRKLSPRRLKWVAINLGVLALFLVGWDLAARFAESIFFPQPLRVWEAFSILGTQGDLNGIGLFEHMWASTSRVLAGFAIGALVGVPLGLLFGLVPALYKGSRLVVEPFRFIPPIAWIPLAIVLLGGFERYIFLIFLGAFFPVFVATMVGVPRVERIHQQVVQISGGGRLYTVRHVVIPSVMPDILGGMRVALGAAWMTIVAAEMTGGSQAGLGRMMINYAELIQIPQVIVGMIIIGLLGFLFNEVVLMLELWLFRWRTTIHL